MGSAFLFEAPDAIATITISKEAKSNSLTAGDFAELRCLLKTADSDPEVRVIVLTGSGHRTFCAGADLSKDAAFFEKIASGTSTGLGDVLRTARQLSKPLLGRVNGHCYAGGIGLLGACDIVVACDDALFALPEIKLNLFPFVVIAGLSWRVRPSQFVELALTGNPIDAECAARIGLISRFVPRGDLDRTVKDLAVSLAAKPALPTALGLRALRGEFDDFEKALHYAEAQTRHLALIRSGTKPVNSTSSP